MTRARYTRGTNYQPDTDLESALIAAVFDGKRFVTADGEDLPVLKKGAQIKLRIMLRDFADPQQAGEYFRQGHRAEVLPAGTRLLAVVKDADTMLTEFNRYIRNLPPSEQQPMTDRRYEDIKYAQRQLQHLESRYSENCVKPTNPMGAVEVILLDPLITEQHAGKKPRLAPCFCRIPYLEQQSAKPIDSANSLNHAFTKISERFEILRISHTGNAFTRFFADVGHGSQRLDALAEEALQKQANNHQTISL